ncbi:MAG: flagellar hook assembly protein FlgD [Burkholderiales bacterium]|nr:flagellar hook assembly protein FlgD [Burkholderiales bacterium]MDE2394322.1 flagellar hook assembly protein FlgD [Burkholderiales bacterium]MDE2452490.1 flagellar hook assembly protein FlgD [Burkholderiales bacterium]
MTTSSSATTQSSTNAAIFASINANAKAAATTGASASGGSSSAAMAAVSPSTFLTLLVTQMQNQDPLSPMDNSQMTSQLAQINTVSGINTLNTSVQSLNTQLVQMQALQAATLVGQNVTVPGNDLTIKGGSGQGAFKLAGAADSVTVQVLDPSGQVVANQSLGAMPAGVQGISWPAGTLADASPGYTFKVAATQGGAAVPTTALMLDKVNSVFTSNGVLTLDLQNSGNVPYTSVQSLN